MNKKNRIMFLYVMLLSIGFIGIAFIGFALNILFKKNGHFPETSVGKNKALRAKNVYCIKTEQKLIDKQIKAGDNTICSSC